MFEIELIRYSDTDEKKAHYFRIDTDDPYEADKRSLDIMMKMARSDNDKNAIYIFGSTRKIIKGQA